MADGSLDQLTFGITDAARAAGLIVDLVVQVILRFRVRRQFQLLPGIQRLMVLGCQMGLLILNKGAIEPIRTFGLRGLGHVIAE